MEETLELDVDDVVWLDAEDEIPLDVEVGPQEPLGGGPRGLRAGGGGGDTSDSWSGLSETDNPPLTCNTGWVDRDGVGACDLSSESCGSP